VARTEPREAGSTAAFYESLWRGGADAENRARWGFQDELVEAGLRALEPVAGRTVVEVGPGTGRESARLAGAGARVVALDLTRASLERVRAASGGRTLAVQARAETLPLTAASADRVFAQTVLMHLDLAAAAAEWVRVLRPGGRVVVVEPLAGNPLVGLYRRLLSPYRRTRPSYVTLAAIERSAAGLRLVRHEERYLLEVAALGVPERLRPPARRVLAALDRRLFRLPSLRRLAWMTLVVLEKPAG
jgi:SAM-dependent methyltransferase